VAGTIASSTSRGADGNENFHKWVDLVAGKPSAWKTHTIPDWWKDQVIKQGGVLVNAKLGGQLLGAGAVSGGSGGGLALAVVGAVLAKILLF
jgi:hypothetical protein